MAEVSNKAQLTEGGESEDVTSKFKQDMNSTDTEYRGFVTTIGMDVEDSLFLKLCKYTDYVHKNFDIRISDSHIGYIDTNISFDYLLNVLEQLGEVYSHHKNRFTIINFTNGNIIEFNLRCEESGVPWYRCVLSSTSMENCENIKDFLIKEIETDDVFGIVPIKLLFRKSDGMIANIDKRELIDDEIFNEAYPFVNNGNVDEYIHNYLESDESVMILIGPPGTGKTRLIRYILRESLKYNKDQFRISSEIAEKLKGRNKGSIYYTNSESVLNTDEIFADILSDKASYLVLEDIDFHLRDRGDDNPLMYKLLSITDGLMKGGTNKIIISTNVDNERDIDQALTRVGRCFDIARFRNLNYDESNNMLQKLSDNSGIFMPEEREFSLSEVYRYYNKGSLESQPQNKTVTRGKKPGFL